MTYQEDSGHLGQWLHHVFLHDASSTTRTKRFHHVSVHGTVPRKITIHQKKCTRKNRDFRFTALYTIEAHSVCGVYVPVQYVLLRTMGVRMTWPSLHCPEKVMLSRYFLCRYRPKRTYGDLVFPLDNGRREVFDAGAASPRSALGDGDGDDGHDSRGGRNFTMDVSSRDAWTLEFTLCERTNYQ